MQAVDAVDVSGQHVLQLLPTFNEGGAMHEVSCLHVAAVLHSSFSPDQHMSLHHNSFHHSTCLYNSNALVAIIVAQVAHT